MRQKKKTLRITKQPTFTKSEEEEEEKTIENKKLQCIKKIFLNRNISSDGMKKTSI